jgi:hypothetical protein
MMAYIENLGFGWIGEKALGTDQAQNYPRATTFHLSPFREI